LSVDGLQVTEIFLALVAETFKPVGVVGAVVSIVPGQPLVILHGRARE
jgi:hypothetical protein